MTSSEFVPVSAELLDLLRSYVGPESVISDPASVLPASQDFYWYSPILKRQLSEKRADAIVKVPSREALSDVIAAAFAADVPITLRGAGTGNYGQSIPLKGGLLVDLSPMDQILGIADGVAHLEPGVRLQAIENAARPLGYELRCYPSTIVKATVGGFIGGGSGGIGSISWGGLRDLGTIKALEVMTVEAQPKVVRFTEDECLKIFHAYGTNGIIVGIELRLAPKRSWDQIVLASPDIETLIDVTDQIARDDSVPKRLVSLLELPLPTFFKPIKKFYPEGHHVTFLEVDSSTVDAVRMIAQQAGVAVSHIIPHHEPRRSPMLSDYTWNHTTLWALKADPSLTYLQSGFGENFREQRRLLHAKFPGDIHFHFEWVRGNHKLGDFGKVIVGGIPVVRYRSDEQLASLIDYCTEIGVFTANPHVYQVEAGGRDHGHAEQRALKQRHDPKALLNPGKLRDFKPESS